MKKPLNLELRKGSLAVPSPTPRAPVGIKPPSVKAPRTLGRTSSGKPIHAEGAKASAGYNSADHAEAAAAHKQAAWAHSGTPKAAHHSFMANYHAHRAATMKSMNTTGKSMKSKGPGSRGGHVIGKTKHGKPIYEKSHAKNQNMLKQWNKGSDSPAKIAQSAFPEYSWGDHLDASKKHRDNANKLDKKKGHGEEAQQHHMLADLHGIAAHPKSDPRHVKKSIGYGFEHQQMGKVAAAAHPRMSSDQHLAHRNKFEAKATNQKRLAAKARVGGDHKKAAMHEQRRTQYADRAATHHFAALHLDSQYTPDKQVASKGFSFPAAKRLPKRVTGGKTKGPRMKTQKPGASFKSLQEGKDIDMKKKKSVSCPHCEGKMSKAYVVKSLLRLAKSQGVELDDDLNSLLKGTRPMRGKNGKGGTPTERLGNKKHATVGTGKGQLTSTRGGPKNADTVPANRLNNGKQGKMKKSLFPENEAFSLLSVVGNDGHIGGVSDARLAQAIENNEIVQPPMANHRRAREQATNHLQ